MTVQRILLASVVTYAVHCGVRHVHSDRTERSRQCGAWHTRCY